MEFLPRTLLYLHAVAWLPVSCFAAPYEKTPPRSGGVSFFRGHGPVPPTSTACCLTAAWRKNCSRGPGPSGNRWPLPACRLSLGKDLFLLSRQLGRRALPPVGSSPLPRRRGVSWQRCWSPAPHSMPMAFRKRTACGYGTWSCRLPQLRARKGCASSLPRICTSARKRACPSCGEAWTPSTARPRTSSCWGATSWMTPCKGPRPTGKPCGGSGPGWGGLRRAGESRCLRRPCACAGLCPQLRHPRAG